MKLVLKHCDSGKVIELYGVVRFCRSTYFSNNVGKPIESWKITLVSGRSLHYPLNVWSVFIVDSLELF